MSVLQAARAHVLGMPLESAYSWGLNRAIFIAAARRGFKGGSGGESSGEAREPQMFSLGDDSAYRVEREGAMLFTIGGKVQTKAEFDKRVRARFGTGFPKAWAEAVAYVKGFDRSVLLSRDEFFSRVYRPARDQLAAKWSADA